MKISLLIILILFCGAVAAHHDSTTIINLVPPAVTETSITNTVRSIDDDELNKIVAMSVAGDQCHHDFATFDIQGCAGIGGFHDENAAAFSIGKRFADTRILFNCSIATAFDGEAAYGCGGNWRF